MTTKLKEGLIRGPVTNTPLRRPAYGPLFFLRTGMLLLASCCTSVAIALEFWAANRAIQNQNALLKAFQSPAVVWVSVHDIYTTSMVTVIGFCFLWIILAIGIYMSIRYARKPYESFDSIPFIISTLSIWILISGTAETWFWARSGLKIYVSVNNMQVPQSDIDAVLFALGVHVRYKDSTMWRAAVAFIWVAWTIAVAAVIILFIADRESARFVRPTTISGNAPATIGLVNVNDTEIERTSFDRSQPLRIRAGGEAGANASRDSGIQEVPINGSKKPGY